MEPVQAQSINISTSQSLCSTVSNGDNGTNEITKQLEHDLLYGDGDGEADGDDGPALSDDNLSDDSYRLRLSDDDTEGAKDHAAKTVNKQQEQEIKNKTENPQKESTPNTDSTETKLVHPMTNGMSEVNLELSNSQSEDFTNDDVPGKDNFCVDSETFNSEPCPQLNDVKANGANESDAESSFNDSMDTSSVNDSDKSSVVNNSTKTIVDESEITSKRESPAVVEEKSPEQDAAPVVEEKYPDEDVTSVVEEKSPEPNSLECNSVPQEQQPENDDSECKITDISGNSEVVEDNPPKEASVETNGDEHNKSSESLVEEKSCDNESESLDLECFEKISDPESCTSVNNVTPLPETEASDDKQQDSKKIELDTSKDITLSKIVCTDEEKDNGRMEVVDETSTSSDKSLVDPNDLVADFSNKTNNEIIDIDDDNTLDSTASGGVQSSTNETVDEASNSSTSKRKSKDNEIKETDAEKENSDSSRHLKRRKASTDALLIAGNGAINTRSRRSAVEKKTEESMRKSTGSVSKTSDKDSAMIGSTSVPQAQQSSDSSRRSLPTSLKRKETDAQSDLEAGTAKKFKTDTGKENAQTVPEARKKLDGVRRFFLRDTKNKLKKLSPEELEDMLIQKIIEAITMRDEIGKLREQAKIAEKNQEATRAKCQQLAKQINDFEMVLNRYAGDRRTNPNAATPVKINRSVGLQVNFLTDQGTQNLRQLQTAAKTNVQKPLAKGPPTNSSLTTTSPQATNDSANQNVRRGIKTRSPRRADAPTSVAVTTTAQIIRPNQTPILTMTQTTMPISKYIDTRNNPIVNTSQISQKVHTSQIVVNGTMNNLQSRTAKVLTSNTKNNANNVIDLTDEEERRSTIPTNTVPPPLTTIITTTNSPAVNGQKVQTRYTRVVSSAPTVTIPQSAIRVVQPAGQPTPTALVNNMSNVGGAPRFVVMQPGRPLLLAPNGHVRATSVNTRTSLSTVSYTKSANGPVRVMPASGTTATLQVFKHPAPLPDVNNYQSNPALKLPPPAPSLKITKVPHGIVLSWNVQLSDKYAEIASYQLYAYQEMPGVPPVTSNWKKVGDVRALPLPMACTLTQFSEGNNYYFAVRAVDTHSRYGQYSQPGNISL